MARPNRGVEEDGGDACNHPIRDRLNGVMRRHQIFDFDGIQALG
jgi:hypothetical protein